MNAHEIDFEIEGNEMQSVEIQLDSGESVIAEAGSFMYMNQKMEMETIFGDGTEKNTSFFNKLFNAGKRVLTGESLFLTAYTFNGLGKGSVAFAAPYPGRILPMDLSELGGKIICQKDAFLCAAKGTSVGMEFRKKLGVGLFGGEGFIMQKLEGDGMAFVHACGNIVKKSLGHGEVLSIDTGCLVAMTQNINYDIKFVGGIKNTLFGGEGLFYAELTGPGEVWLQSLPFSRLANRVLRYAPRAGGKGKGEGKGGGGQAAVRQDRGCRLGHPCPGGFDRHPLQDEERG